MSEVDQDYVATRSGNFRTSRYPGFVGGRTDPTTGNLVVTPVGVNPVSSLPSNSVDAAPETSKSLGDFNYDIPRPQEADIVKGLGQAAAGGAATYAGGVVGTEVGKTLAAGGTAAEGFQQGANVLGDKVASIFTGGGETAAASAGSNLVPMGLNTVAGGHVPPPAGAGEVAGSAAGEAAGSAAGEAGGFSPGTLGGAAGVGLTTAAVGLAMGQKPAKALKSGAGSGIGYAVGTAVGGPIGGFVGSAIGGAVGGRVICTELWHQNKIEYRLLVADLAHAKEYIAPETLRGYHVWAVPVVRWMRRDDWFGRFTTAVAGTLATWRAKEIADGDWRGKIVRAIGEPICYAIGSFVAETDWHQLYEMETRR